MAALQLWLITDGRLGHLNQLRGLVTRLQQKTATQVHWLNIAEQGFKYTGRAGLELQFTAGSRPDWIISAGSRSHLPLLWCKWMTGGRALVLMRPSWPLWMFDAVCMPFHDSPPPRKNILGTHGVINHIVPVKEGRQVDRGLILLGGINKHFHWDNDVVLNQLRQISEAAPGVEWLVSNSPRTPQGLLESVAALQRPNIRIMPYSDTGPGWLPATLAEVAQVWVSCDSVSMVYESISSGAATGLLTLEPMRESRVTRSMAQVRRDGLAVGFDTADLSQALPPAAQSLWEADRAADWLLAL
jgi:mitochondrial fission protein ELM1